MRQIRLVCVGMGKEGERKANVWGRVDVEGEVLNREFIRSCTIKRCTELGVLDNPFRDGN